jgi:hypothetical protein
MLYDYVTVAVESIKDKFTIVEYSGMVSVFKISIVVKHVNFKAPRIMQHQYIACGSFGSVRK